MSPELARYTLYAYGAGGALLGSFSALSGAASNPQFIGVGDTDGAAIHSVKFTYDGPTAPRSGALGDFAINAVATGGVPEPGAWAMMILGFGLAGSAMRRRTGTLATA